MNSLNLIVTLNPATNEKLEEFVPATRFEINESMERSNGAFQNWRNRSVRERCSYLFRLSEVLGREKTKFAKTISLEMGKVLKESIAEIEKCANEAKYYAENAERFLAPEKMPVAEAEAYVSFLPLGPLLAIMPWNFPFWQFTRFALPALAAGNTVILKHSSNVCRSALEIKRAFELAGFPAGVLEVVIAPSSEMEYLISDERIKGVSLTGSGKAGASVAAIAGQHFKKSVLELGGSDAFIVLKDARIDDAVQAAIKARFSNAGQVCIAAKRFFIEEALFSEFSEKFVSRVKRLNVGDPFSEATDLGPLARIDLRDELHEQVQKSIQLGARLLCGGKPVSGRGAYYEPTVLTAITRDMPVFKEETFGPVAALTSVKDVEEAVKLANDSEFGLSANLWTEDFALARSLAARLEAGSVFINSYSRSDPRVPIRGIKKSGYGRELSHFGIREFTNIQTTWIESSNHPHPQN